MSDVSRIIRERALAILRETRAKIDPALLSAMKDRISEIMPQAANPDMPLSKKATPVASEEKFVPPLMDVPVPNETEPVDKQKIAQIVLQYMKYKENGSKH